MPKDMTPVVRLAVFLKQVGETRFVSISEAGSGVTCTLVEGLDNTDLEASFR